MSHRDRYPAGRERFIDLYDEDYTGISERIAKCADAAKYSGEIAKDTEITRITEIFGAVNCGGSANLPGLIDKVGNNLTAHHSFDLKLESGYIPGEEPAVDVSLRLYGHDSGYTFHVERVSGSEYISYLMLSDSPAPDAESPDNDHAKLSDDDIKAILWSLSRTGDEDDFGFIDQGASVLQTAEFAIGNTEDSAHSRHSITTYNSEGFEDITNSPQDQVPGSRLTVVESRAKESESKEDNSTTYILNTRHSEALEGPDGQDVLVWAIYSFQTTLGSDETIRQCSANVELVLQYPEEEFLLPEFWIKFQQEAHQSGVRRQFSSFMTDALSDLFTERP